MWMRRYPPGTFAKCLKLFALQINLLVSEKEFLQRDISV